MLLALAVLLGLAGIALTVVDALRPEPPEPEVTIAVANTDIPTYTIIEPHMVSERTVKQSQARSMFAYALDEAVGMITTEPVAPDTIIGRGEAKPVKEVRFVEDLGMEVTSFSGRFDEMVGGQLNPGTQVNIYGYHESLGRDEPGDVTLIASNVWVVDVRASSGEAAGQEPAATPSQGSGGLLGGGPGMVQGQATPASIVTVAAQPQVVWDIIQALGAGGYQAWVTLAGKQAFQPTPVPSPTTQPTYTPLPTYTPFPSPTVVEQTQEEPTVAGTPTPSDLPTTGGAQPGN